MVTKIVKLFIIGIITFIVSYLFYMLFIYKGNNPKERNTISFKNNIDSVLNAMEKMNHILDSSNINEYFFYAAPIKGG